MRNDLRKLALEQPFTHVLLTFTSKLENRCFMFVSCAKSGGVVGSDDDAVRAKIHHQSYLALWRPSS